MSPEPTEPAAGLDRRQFLVGAGALSLVAACSSSDDGDAGGAAPRRRPERSSFAYGDHPHQVVDLWRPADRVTPTPVVALIHGGYWRPGFDRSLMDPLAADVVDRGWAAWNVDYRPAGDGTGGGWPGTFADVATAIDRLDRAARAGRGLDLDRVVTVGHSAGGCLALWAAARAGLPAEAPGGSPAVVVRAAVSQAGVNDLVAGVEDGLGGGAVVDLMGSTPDEDKGRYALASPAARLPIGVPQVLVHGTADDVVPLDQSEAYARAAVAAGDQAELIVVDGADHFDVIDPGHEAWRRVVTRLEGLLA